MPTHSTAPRIVAEYFESLRWLAASAEESSDETHSRRIAALATISAVAAVEVFLNLWFRSLVAERKDTVLEVAFEHDLDSRTSLDQKLATWPTRYLGAELSLTQGPGRAFKDLKELRNSIVHFVSAHETIRTPTMIVHGLADTSKYDNLTAKSARLALSVAEGLVAEVFRVAGFDETAVRTARAGWIAKRGSDPSLEPTHNGVSPSWATSVKR